MKISAAGGTVALCLAFGFALGFNVFCFAVLYTAITSDAPLSENATQVLTGWGGGMIGVIGSYIGYRVGLGETYNREGEKSGSD